MAITDSLAAFYPFNGSGKDVSVNGNDLAMTGGTFNPTFATTDGTDDFMSASDGYSGIGGNDEMTLYVKFQKDRIDTQEFFMGYGLVAVFKYIFLRTLADNTMGADFGNDADDDFARFVTTGAITDLLSTHILFARYNAGTVTINLDNVNKTGAASGTHTGNVVSPTTKLRYACVDNGANVGFFKGDMYEAAVWNREITDAEVAQINSDDGLVIPSAGGLTLLGVS